MDFTDELLQAYALAFDMARGVQHCEAEMEIIESLQLKDFDPALLAMSLVLRIENPEEGDADYIPTMFWLLGKRHDPALLPFFRTSLRSALATSPDSVYQILIALDNLDEAVFAPDRNGSYSARDKELNRRDAAAYLEQLG